MGLPTKWEQFVAFNSENTSFCYVFIILSFLSLGCGQDWGYFQRAKNVAEQHAGEKAERANT